MSNENAQNEVGMDPATPCQWCLGLKKELGDCHILAKAVECKLEVEIKENSQLQTQVGELPNWVVSQSPSTEDAGKTQVCASVGTNSQWQGGKCRTLANVIYITD